MKRRRAAWWPLGAALALIAASSSLISLRSAGSPVTIRTAVDRFRAAAEPTPTGPVITSAPPPSGLAKPRSLRASVIPRRSAAPAAVSVRDDVPLPPREGVYTYATSGWEDVDALGGARHTYPDQTTATVRRGGCGFLQRWDAIAERWDEREDCPSSTGGELRRMTSYHEFFKHGETHTFTCAPGSPSRPVPSAPAGTTWDARCSSTDSLAEIHGTVVGRDTIPLGGAGVETIHYLIDVRVTGQQTGTARDEVWTTADTGLVVVRHAMTTTDSQTSAGPVHYREEYRITLDSLDPRT